jgi:hypothetical protein
MTTEPMAKTALSHFLNQTLQRSNNMAFVNERITAEKDQERYKIPEIKRRIVPGPARSTMNAVSI